MTGSAITDGQSRGTEGLIRIESSDLQCSKAEKISASRCRMFNRGRGRTDHFHLLYLLSMLARSSTSNRQGLLIPGTI
jgi:hypothetical protein